MEKSIEFLVIFGTIALVVVALAASYLNLQSRRRAWERSGCPAGINL